MTAEQDRAYALAHWLGLTPKASAVLAELYAARGRPLMAEELARRTVSEASSVVRVHLPILRQVLCDGAIDYTRGVGYWLTAEGLEECRGALRTLGTELLEAA
jgi:DNA-binding response OmpR family regulator